jgi:hypothetical protein
LPGQQPPGDILFWFDWIDSTGQPQTSPQTPLIPGPVFEEWWIDFCPPQVSIHFELLSPTAGPGYHIEGIFVHECLIPEPSTYAGVAGLGLVGFTVLRRFRRGAGAA